MIGNTKLLFIRGDITEQDTRAIVNAANSGLLGGGGVDGAIHRAGGPQILEECKQIRSTKGICPAGQAVITGAGRLKADYVIHTVGPIWSGGGGGEDELLRQAYANSLKLAVKNGVKTISFPSISTGAYRFPRDRAAAIAVKAVYEFVKESAAIDEVRFVLFNDDILKAFELAWEKLGCAGDSRDC
ncbi:O-acetyl-ADP-ribose deacetylase [Desulfocucumis palustris]|uniref:O-acetyl-ADP-ribose deacetylase n=1 Tax=Desulfocucumis palustris TaxID=1898651 RepID=UPI000CEA25AE|nr:O-acetyl-ADP-ribose deacetylase [Desulfocucumis palustris]